MNTTKSNKHVSMKHKMLVASAEMGDGAFAKCVIFILEHDKEHGAFGVVVNRQAEQEPCTCGECHKSPYPIYLGGPCDINSRMMMLHGIKRVAKEKYQLMSGLWQGTPRLLNKIVTTIPMDDHRFKVLTGYSGWAPKQLENEIASGAWHVVEATPELVLDGDPDYLWEDICTKTTKSSSN